MNALEKHCTAIDKCSAAIFKQIDGNSDPRKDEIIQVQCKKYNLSEVFIKELLFANDERMENKHKYRRRKRKREFENRT